MQQRILDGFTFFDNIDLLEFRLQLLQGLVDYHVIVEANITHAGNAKPFHLATMRQQLSWAKEKIIYFPIELDTSQLDLGYIPTKYEPQSPHWRLENAQRNFLGSITNRFAGDDILLISDIDEIPTRELLADLKSGKLGKGQFPFVCQQHFFYYSLKWLIEDPWCGTIVTTLSHLKEMSPQSHRYLRNVLPRFAPGGWHLSYFNSVSGIQEKIKNFAHQELNRPEFLNADHIAACMKEGKDLFDRGIKFRTVSHDFFPGYFQRLVNSFPRLFSI